MIVKKSFIFRFWNNFTKYINFRRIFNLSKDSILKIGSIEILKANHTYFPFNLAMLKPATLLKESLWLRCFPVNFTNILRAPFFHRIPPVAASESMENYYKSAAQFTVFPCAFLETFRIIIFITAALNNNNFLINSYQFWLCIYQYSIRENNQDFSWQTFFYNKTRVKIFIGIIFLRKLPNPKLHGDLVRFTEEILNRKLYFLCSETNRWSSCGSPLDSTLAKWFQCHFNP